jgi:hypothetical protein
VPKTKLTKGEKLEQKMMAEAQAKNCYVKKSIPKVETVIVTRPKPVKKPSKTRVLRDDDTDSESEGELSVTSESEVSDGARTLRRIKKTVAAIKKADTVLASGRNFVQMQPPAPRFNPWAR